MVTQRSSGLLSVIVLHVAGCLASPPSPTAVSYRTSPCARAEWSISAQDYAYADDKLWVVQDGNVLTVEPQNGASKRWLAGSATWIESHPRHLMVGSPDAVRKYDFQGNLKVDYPAGNLVGLVARPVDEPDAMNLQGRIVTWDHGTVQTNDGLWQADGLLMCGDARFALQGDTLTEVKPDGTLGQSQPATFDVFAPTYLNNGALHAVDWADHQLKINDMCYEDEGKLSKIAVTTDGIFAMSSRGAGRSSELVFFKPPARHKVETCTWLQTRTRYKYGKWVDVDPSEIPPVEQENLYKFE